LSIEALRGAGVPLSAVDIISHNGDMDDAKGVKKTSKMSEIWCSSCTTMSVKGIEVWEMVRTLRA
jgi:hypothetical protein